MLLTALAGYPKERPNVNKMKPFRGAWRATLSPIVDLEIVHGGGAVAGPDGTWRLKDLLAVRAGGAPPRIRAAC